ncbi:hypothetical protein NP493_801g02046 [Ridgeia piscesae]|uniref:Uncharacterized protein n=1 Tax=Ridgeia piscesae TaxID=27915 RepID=A0AAD9KMS1_RIDPI|nr:hypothetical protein NP493_801g02046 [Ridgeia piscesae]
MSRKNKTEKATSALWKDQSTMAAVAKQKTAQEGQANQGSGGMVNQEGQGGGEPVHQGAGVMSHDITEMRRECRCEGRPGVSHEVEASGDMTVVCGGHTRTDMSALSEDDVSSLYLNDIPQMSTATAVDTESHDRQASQAPDTRERGRVTPSQNCYSSGQESLTSPLDAQYGSGSIPPMFELECDGTSDDEVFDTSCHGDNAGDDDDDDDDEGSRDRPEHSRDASQPTDIRRHDTSQPVDIGRHVIAPPPVEIPQHDVSQPVDIPRLTLTPEASPDTRLFFLPPGGSMPSQHRFMGSLICSAGLSISGQSPLGPDHIMVHEALAWTQRLLTPMQQGQSSSFIVFLLTQKSFYKSIKIKNLTQAH